MAEHVRIAEYYSICLQPYDGAGNAGSLLGTVRKSYFEGKKCVKGNADTLEDGREIHIRYRLADGCFRWKKTCGASAAEEAFCVKNGYRLLRHTEEGGLISSAFFDGAQHWLRTAYYDGDPLHPAVILERTEDGLTLHTVQGDSALTARPWKPGTAEQSCENAKAGEPRVTASTDAGLFCFCTQEELAFREQAGAEQAQVEIALKTAARWEELSEFRPLRNAEGEPEKPAEPAVEIPAPQPEETKSEEQTAPEKTAEPEDYAADREIFTTEDHPAKYAVASKGLSGTVRGGLRRAGDLPAECVPAKRVVVSSAESYLYFGKLIGGLRQGQGRTQMAGGHTAYEGGFRDDRRDGFGVFYYKSGRLCYAGGWKDNLRDGLGVAFGRDGSVFVGNWRRGVADGVGTEFDLAGNPVRTGVWRDGKFTASAEDTEK